MAHTSATSMRAFTKGRCAFDSDEEYRAALRGELDDLGVHEDFGYESGSPEDPDDGEGDEKDAGDMEDLTDEEAVKAELKDLEDRIGGTKFLEILERFMKDCSGRNEPPYLPFPLVRDKEVTAVFRDGSGGLRLRYGAYGFEADRLERTVGAEAWLEVVKTWKGLDAVETLNDWDDALLELAEIEKEDLGDERKDEFFDDLPGILADREHGAKFLGFVVDAVEGRLDRRGPCGIPLDPAADGGEWFHWREDGREFVLREGALRDVASWEEEEFLEKLRETAWDDTGARKSMLAGGDVEDAWDALDDAWYDEDDDGSVEEAVEKFLAIIKGAKEDPSVGYVKKDVAVCDGMKLKLVWRDLMPEMAQLTVLDGGEEDTFDIPLAFLKWWAFGKGRSW